MRRQLRRPAHDPQSTLTTHVGEIDDPELALVGTAIAYALGC